MSPQVPCDLSFITIIYQIETDDGKIKKTKIISGSIPEGNPVETGVGHDGIAGKGSGQAGAEQAA